MTEHKLVYYEDGCFIDVVDDNTFRSFVSFESIKNGTSSHFLSMETERLEKDFGYTAQFLYPIYGLKNTGKGFEDCYTNKIIPINYKKYVSRLKK